MKRSILAVATIFWGLCGFVAMLALAGVIKTERVVDVFLVWPAIVFLLLDVERVLIASAHGPAFLTPLGIFVVYWVPAIAVGGYLFATRRTSP